MRNKKISTMSTHALLAMALLTCASSAFAINKCKGPDGKLVYQDTPCVVGTGGAIEVKPASGGAVPSVQTRSDPNASPQTEADRLNASVAESQKERRLLSLERRGVPDANGAVHQHRDRCKADLARLEQDKLTASRTPRGQGYATQLASEQAATASICNSKDRELVHEHNQVLKECQDLGGCKGGKSL